MRYLYAVAMGMAARAASTFSDDRDGPRTVTVFVTAMGMFMLASFATFYPQETFPGALIGLPIYGLTYALLALGIWNRSRVWWVVNVWMWVALLWRSVAWFVSEQGDSVGPAPDFNTNLLRLAAAVVLLTLLFSPSLFRWIWNDRPTNS